MSSESQGRNLCAWGFLGPYVLTYMHAVHKWALFSPAEALALTFLAGTAHFFVPLCNKTAGKSGLYLVLVLTSCSLLSVVVKIPPTTVVKPTGSLSGLSYLVYAGQAELVCSVKPFLAWLLGDWDVLLLFLLSHWHSFLIPLISGQLNCPGP